LLPSFASVLWEKIVMFTLNFFEFEHIGLLLRILLINYTAIFLQLILLIFLFLMNERLSFVQQMNGHLAYFKR
ncbi:MAG: hypothetical protein ACRCWQ_01915, partial [Bacilli bacterium]